MLDHLYGRRSIAAQTEFVRSRPLPFPPEPFPHGELLAGLGTPDLSGRIGKPFYFTSELFFQPKGGGDFSIEIVELVDNQGTIETEIKGPPNELFPEVGGYITIPMTLTVAEDKSRLGIAVSGTPGVCARCSPNRGAAAPLRPAGRRRCTRRDRLHPECRGAAAV